MPSPTRQLPWDVLLLVFKEADPSTLAVLGRVSLDFLASTAPTLYRDVEVNSVERLESLFCEKELTGRKTKNSSSVSRINPHLDLDQIRTLSLNFQNVNIVSNLEISSSRILLSPSPLLLDILKVSYGHGNFFGAMSRLYGSLFRYLDPIRCACHLIGRPAAKSPWVFLGSFFAAEWTRIRELELSGGITYSLGYGNYHLGGLPAPSLLRRRTVRLDVASLLYDNRPSLKALLRDFARNSAIFGFSEMQDGSIKLVVQTEEEAREAKEVVQTNERIAPWRNVFAVEVEN